MTFVTWGQWSCEIKWKLEVMQICKKWKYKYCWLWEGNSLFRFCVFVSSCVFPALLCLVFVCSSWSPWMVDKSSGCGSSHTCFWTRINLPINTWFTQPFIANLFRRLPNYPPALTLHNFVIKKPCSLARAAYYPLCSDVTYQQKTETSSELG